MCRYLKQVDMSPCLGRVRKDFHINPAFPVVRRASTVGEQRGIKVYKMGHPPDKNRREPSLLAGMNDLPQRRQLFR